MPFVKGAPRPQNAGRRAGTQNRVTVAARTMIEDAAQRIGGSNEKVFWELIFTRLLPLQVRQDGEVRITAEPLSGEQLRQALADRGLPTWVFGVDMPPPLELEATPQAAPPVNGEQA